MTWTVSGMRAMIVPIPRILAKVTGTVCVATGTTAHIITMKVSLIPMGME